MKTSQFGKAASIIITVLAYAAAIAVAVLTPNMILTEDLFLVILAGDIAATIVIFIFSIIFNNSSMYDPYWSVKPAVIMIFYMVYFQNNLTNFHYIVAFLVLLYSIRLTMNFYLHWQGLKQEDWRYADFRKTYKSSYWLISFWGIHFFPTIMVYLGCLPMYFIFSAMQPASLILFYVGAVILAGSVLLAYFSDEQKSSYIKSNSDRKTTLQSGLWNLSRHPNYLGEILSWWGLFIIALSFTSDAWWTGAGALAITLMFVFISIPMIEKRMLNSRPDYADYKKRTPMLIPYLKF